MLHPQDPEPKRTFTFSNHPITTIPLSSAPEEAEVHGFLAMIGFKLRQLPRQHRNEAMFSIHQMLYDVQINVDTSKLDNTVQ